MTFSNISQTINTHKDTYTGIFWKISSCLCFAGVNGVVRYLSGGTELALVEPLPVYIIMFFQNIIGTLLVLPMLLKNKQIINSILTTKYRFLHIVRVTTAVLGIGLWYLSLQYIPLTQAMALSFASPFVAILGAVIFLKEKLNIFRLISIISSIIGGFLIVRPDIGIKDAAYIGYLAIFPFCATLIFALDKLITRKLLANGETAFAVTLLLIMFTSPLCLLPAIYYGWHAPHITHWPWLFLLAVFGICAHFTFSKAFEYAEVTILMPFAIIKIVFCGLIDYFIFAAASKTLNMWIGIGVATISVIVLSCEKVNLSREKYCEKISLLS